MTDALIAMRPRLERALAEFPFNAFAECSFADQIEELLRDLLSISHGTPYAELRSMLDGAKSDDSGLVGAFGTEYQSVTRESAPDPTQMTFAELDRASIRTGCDTALNLVADLELKRRGFRFDATEQRWVLNLTRKAEAGEQTLAPPYDAALYKRLETLAIDYHKTVEGEYGCPGASCPGVQRLCRLLERATVEAVRPGAPQPESAAGEQTLASPEAKDAPWAWKLCEAVKQAAVALDRCRLYGPADAARDAIARAMSYVVFVEEEAAKSALPGAPPRCPEHDLPYVLNKPYAICPQCHAEVFGKPLEVGPGAPPAPLTPLLDKLRLFHHALHNVQAEDGGWISWADVEAVLKEAEATVAAQAQQIADLTHALKTLRTDANRLCDRQLGGSYEDDCRAAIKVADRALAGSRLPDPPQEQP